MNEPKEPIQLTVARAGEILKQARESIPPDARTNWTEREDLFVPVTNALLMVEMAMGQPMREGDDLLLIDILAENIPRWRPVQGFQLAFNNLMSKVPEGPLEIDKIIEHQRSRGNTLEEQDPRVVTGRQIAKACARLGLDFSQFSHVSPEGISYRLLPLYLALRLQGIEHDEVIR